jgi:phage shock protein C
MNDRLYRSRDERMVAGVAGGLAERFDVDPSVVRVLWVVLILLSGGLFLLIYIAMALVVPEARYSAQSWTGPATAGGGPAGPGPAWGTPSGGSAAFSTDPGAGSPPTADGSPPEPGSMPSGPPPDWSQSNWADDRRRRRRERGGGGLIGGTILILLGGYFLIRMLVPELDLGAFWPVVLVAVGVALVIGSIRPRRDAG